MSDVIAIKSPDGMVVIAHGFAVGGSATATVPTGTGFRHVTADVEDDAVTTLAALKTSLLLTGTNSGDQDLSGYQPLDSDLTAIAALSTTSYGRSLLALADAAAGRTLLGLGTAATTASSAYDAAGAAAAAQAASQPLDSDLTAIAALTTTSYGRAFLTLADAAAGRTALALGTAATTAASAYATAAQGATADAAVPSSNYIILPGTVEAAGGFVNNESGNGKTFYSSHAITSVGEGAFSYATFTLSGLTQSFKTGVAGGVNALALAADGSATFAASVTATSFSGAGTGLTGTAASLTAGTATTVTTNANLTGDVTSVGNATTLTNAPVIAKVLTGYSSGAGTVAATDTILQAIQKLNGNDATNANLTGVITSVGNATSIASQTGTGTKFVVDTSPTLVTPLLGTPTSGTLTNCSGYTVANLSGAGTGVLTALGVNVGSAGAPVTFNGAGGTPSSMTGTNITGIPPAAVTGTAAILGANTFTATQTITEAVGSSALALTGATQTTSQPVINATQTWNASGVTFTGWKLNVTATASAAASPLLDLQVAGTSRFKVNAATGQTTAIPLNTSLPAFTADTSGNSGFGAFNSGTTLFSSGNIIAYAGSSRFAMIAGTAFGWVAGTDVSVANDLTLIRAAAATLQQGAANAASPVAQTLQAQGSRGGTDTNVAGAAYTMNAGLGTGNSVPATHTIGGGATSATSGTTAQTAVPRIISGASKVLANNTVTTVANVTNASNTSAAGTIDYTVEVWDGTNLQYEVGSISYGINNKGGAFTQNSTTKYGNTQGVTSGTLTVTWTITAANPGAIQINANSSLTPSTGFPRVTYQLQNLAQQAVAIA